MYGNACGKDGSKRWGGAAHTLSYSRTTHAITKENGKENVHAKMEYNENGKQKYKIKTRNKTKMHVPTGRTTDSQRTRTRDIKERGTHVLGRGTHRGNACTRNKIE